MDISGDQWDNLLDATKDFINTLIPAFYEKTGVKVYLTSGWRPYSSNGSEHHMNGEAFDVAGDELNDVSLRNLYGEMAKQTGDCTPLDEYYSAGVNGAEWWDGSYWSTSGDNFHITVHGSPTGTPSGGPKLDEKSQKVQDFIDWCVKVANDNNPPHLYESGGEGPNYDCTGFISCGLHETGYDITPCHGSGFDDAVVAAGFEKLDYSDSDGTGKLQAGDILSNPHHVELYIGNDQVVGAHGADNHGPADQISVEGYFTNQWTNIFRFPGISGVNGPSGKGPKGSKLMSAISSLMNNPFLNNIKEMGNMLVLLPPMKTYCESVYPDCLYVAGNIPCSAVEKTAVSSIGSLDKAGDYSLMTGQAMQDITGLNTSQFTTPTAQALAQRSFDPSNAILEVKVPNAGKPLNDSDPYPVDRKIEELERHLPRVKQYKMPFNKKCAASKSVSAAILHISDYTEKRIVRLENILATMMRYVIGMGRRMFVNCQYYGGQDHRSKYTCIRCLKDDRTDDGQVMTIDQCLSCTRYEPIIGQHLIAA